MSEPVMLPTDEAPIRWVDEHPRATAQEAAAGERLRLSIDVDDDTDDGFDGD